MHEHSHRFAVPLRGFELAAQPNHARCPEPKIGTTAAARHHVEKDTAATRYLDDIRQLADMKASIEIVERSRLEVVVARNRMPWQDQARQFVVDDAELLRRTVIGVVSGQVDEIELSRGILVHLIDDAAQIGMVLQTRIGDVQVSDLKETQRLFGLVQHCFRSRLQTP
jgi:hypothetical protein